MSDRPFFFLEEPTTEEEVDKVTEQWADDITAALGTLVTEGYFRFVDRQSNSEFTVLSDVHRLTVKGRSEYERLIALVAHALPQGSGMPEYYAAAQWLIDQGHTELSLHPVYGLLTWGTQTTNEMEDRNTMMDGFRRKWHPQRPDGFKLADD